MGVWKVGKNCCKRSWMRSGLMGIEGFEAASCARIASLSLLLISALFLLLSIPSAAGLMGLSTTASDSAISSGFCFPKDYTLGRETKDSSAVNFQALV